MLYIEKEKRKTFLIIGFIGMALFAIGDVLMQSFSNDGTDILLMMKSSVKDMPIERLYFSLLTGVIAAPSMYFGLCAMDSYLRDRIGNQKGKMYRCFQAGSIIGALSFFSAHSVCAVLMMAVKQALVCGITPETVDAAYRIPFLVSFIATNLWVTVTEVCLSVAFIFFVLKRTIPLPKAAVLLNTIGFFIIFNVVSALLTSLTGNEIFTLLGKSSASLGMGAMFLATACVCGKVNGECSITPKDACPLVKSVIGEASVSHDANKKDCVLTIVCNSGIDNSGSAERLLCKMAEDTGIQRSDIRYVMATGYSRKGIEIADDDVSEITAHAYGVRLTAPPEFVPGMIIDIGGQDSKIIYLDKSFHVKNFNMNDKCAAGTGKFMEVTAQILETTIDQIGPLSLQSKAPCDINSMCVVFAQSEIISLIARKYDRSGILAGMHRSMVKRMVRMIKNSEMNGDILMTGGGALNIGLHKSFEEELLRDVFVASHPQFNGAIGAALLGSEEA